MAFNRGNRHGGAGAGSSPDTAAPTTGKRTLTESIRSSPDCWSGASVGPVEVASGPTRALTEPDCGEVAAVQFRRGLDERGWMLAHEGLGVSSDVQRVAAQGVSGGGSSLPHLDTIQRSFGQHDVSGISAHVGGAAATATAAIGAEAYATGDRVAFASSPSLFVAAHEAAHVVQQRAGVSLLGGVGQSGDGYERQADAVASRVVAGESAEPLLAASSGAGGGGGAVQRFDSGHHVGIGDSVAGESVTIEGVTFTPGELAALADYVGDVTTLRDYEPEQLAEMKALLAANNEEAEDWDRVTGGKYSEEAQNNEKHFAPGGDGRDFASTFIEYYGRALDQAGNADLADATAVEDARLNMYTAEHYLEDAFSAGHHVAAIDVETAVDAVITQEDFLRSLPGVAGSVYDQSAAIIQHYGDPVIRRPLDRVTFQALATVGGVFVTGVGGYHDAMRRYVHENLAEIGVEVMSLSHPEPWVLRGDHTADPTSVAVLQDALAEVRQRFEQSLGTPVDDPQDEAATMFLRTAPMPTVAGGAAVAQAIADATSSSQAIFDAVAQATSETIEEAMDVMVGMGIVVELREVDDEKHALPVIPPHDPDGGEWGINPPPGEWGGDSAIAEPPVIGQPAEGRSEAY